MKVTIDVDLTPVEARQLVGLPDVQPLQNSVMAEIEQRMMAEAKKFSTEGLMKGWLSGEGTEAFSNMLGSFFSLARSAGKRPASSKDTPSE